MRMGAYIGLLLLATFLAGVLFDLLHQLMVEQAKLREAGVKEVEFKLSIDRQGKR